jgi:hypothetical protein
MIEENDAFSACVREFVEESFAGETVEVAM